MHISPLTRMPFMAEIISKNPGSSSGPMPPFCASPPMLTSIITSCTTPARAARRSISCASAKRSTDWIISTFPMIYFTLFVCNCPIKFTSAPRARKNSSFPVSSCTRFSPTAVTPQSSASEMRASSTNFVTAISLTVFTSRPAIAAAFSMFSRIVK